MRILFRIAATIATLAAFFTAVPRSAAEPRNMPPTVETAVYAQIPAPPTDPRIAELDAFFQKHKCPYKNSTSYLSAADKYKIDFRLLPAISIIEESCGLHNPNNNLFGFGSAEHLKKFPTIEVGIDYVASQLSTSRFYKNKSLKQVLYAYNSVNPNYYREVTGLMSQIAP